MTLPTTTTFLLAALAAAVALSGCTTPPEPTDREDRETITIPAGQGVEYKLFMREGDEIQYEWSADSPLYYDFHGDRDGADPDDFTSYKTGTTMSDGATFTADFTGRHGWYWENDWQKDVTLELHTDGVYAIHGYV